MLFQLRRSQSARHARRKARRCSLAGGRAFAVLALHVPPPPPLECMYRGNEERLWIGQNGWMDCSCGSCPAFYSTRAHQRRRGFVAGRQYVLVVRAEPALSANVFRYFAFDCFCLSLSALLCSLVFTRQRGCARVQAATVLLGGLALLHSEAPQDATKIARVECFSLFLMRRA